MGNAAAALLNCLAEFDDLAGQRVFAKERHDCGVCLATKSGSECVRFAPCAHVFCTTCAAAYYAVQIRFAPLFRLRSL